MAALPPMPGTDASVTPFDKTHLFFTGDDNKRIVDSTTTFPTEGEYSQIILHLSLDCPQGGCDAWDRFGTLGIVTTKGATQEEDEVIEIARYITPYGVAGTWAIDVTDLRPLFRGELTMRTFIDTWVGPGSPYGAGWLVTASFEMKGGIPAKIPKAVVPVWNRKYVAYGDPAKPIAMSVPEQDIVLPKGSSYALRALVTGHGQGNAGNCAEFCKRIHTITAGVAPHAEQIWRADCATTAVPNQQGTWKYSRAGWCPGADVKPWQIDITTDVAGTTTAKIAYGVGNYENTCRPDAATCSGCTLGSTCDYDGGAHTEPNYQFSTLLIAYE
jgi:Peptide-N-glycosidase F, C terminal/Peptide-N-glycosidase F, N terminal